MGLVIGQKNPKTIKSEEIGNEYRERMNNKGAAAAAAAEEQKRMQDASNQDKLGGGSPIPKTLEEEEKALRHNDELLTRIMALPKKEQPQALKDAGFPLLSEMKAKVIADEKAKAEKLDAIMAMPLEERVGALLDAGFNEEAAAENARISAMKKWSAIIDLFSKYGAINKADAETYDKLTKASDPEGTAQDRVIYCQENGLEELGNYYNAIIEGKETFESVEEWLAKTYKAPGIDNGEGDGAPADAAATQAPTTEAENADGAGADAETKKKPGRPAGSTKKD